MPIIPSSRTLRFKELTEDDLHQHELIISASDATENRGQLPLWSHVSRSDEQRVLWVKQSGKEKIRVNGGGRVERDVSLRDDAALDELLLADRVLMDISGMPHVVWAPLLKRLHANSIATRIIYAEPESYKEHPSPASATRFDLSVTFEGLSPLPGYARLSGPQDEEKCLFVPMLGFEGNRPESLVLQIDPAPRIIPVVGVPGFRPEYPAFTVACNRVFLEENRVHSEIRFAMASCPFEAYETLMEIRRDYADHYMYLAPIGTKPHALGTVLFSLAHPEDTEIMFDHPVRRPGRTAGVGVIHIYEFGNFSAYRS